MVIVSPSAGPLNCHHVQVPWYRLYFHPARWAERFRLSLLEINIFGGLVPESVLSSRNNPGTSAPARSAGGYGGKETRGELRLRVLCSLPQSHKRYLFSEIQSLCSDYLRKNRIPAQELTTEELVSEVWLKLLGNVSSSNDEET